MLLNFGFNVNQLINTNMKDLKGREALNNRFVKAFKLLEEKGEIIRNGHAKGLSAVSEQILGKKSHGHLINKYLTGERFIPYEAAERFCEIYAISKDFMFKGEGKVFAVTGLPIEYETGYRAPVEIVQESKILYSAMPALASSALGIEMNESLEYFNIPGMKGGQYVAFTISGNSMTPTLRDSDMVICKPFDNPERIIDNEVYAIVSDLAVQVKRIQKIYDFKTKKLQKIKLISDNYLEHDPFYLEIQQVRKILKVDRKITGL